MLNFANCASNKHLIALFERIFDGSFDRQRRQGKRI
jgi:hypothetical protein